MDVLLTGLAKDAIEWVDERFGRLAAWFVAVVSVLALTVGAVLVASHLIG